MQLRDPNPIFSITKKQHFSSVIFKPKVVKKICRCCCHLRHFSWLCCVVNHSISTTQSFYVVVVHTLNFSLWFSVLLRAVLVCYTQPAGPRVPQAAGQRRGGPTQSRPFQVVLEAPAFTSRWWKKGRTDPGPSPSGGARGTTPASPTC